MSLSITGNVGEVAEGGNGDRKDADSPLYYQRFRVYGVCIMENGLAKS